jgi:hypothetical protein
LCLFVLGPMAIAWNVSDINQRGSTGLFNVFINDIFHFVQDSTIYNYADDNTLSYSDTNINTVVKTLENG